MSNRSVRSLAHLHRTASTARVLNLHRVALDYGQTDGWRERPIFRNSALNRALLIKHRLRRDEIDLFSLRRHIATKIVVPIDAAELGSGGRAIFVDQRGFERGMQEIFGLAEDHPDLVTLRLMDKLPSLDPFLLREQLNRHGMEPASCYFTVSDSDLAAMERFVEDEIRPLVTLSFGGDIEAVGSTRRFAGKILSNRPGDHLELLRHTLQLRAEDYEEGVFCWKGFLYYKWVLTSLVGEAEGVGDAVLSIRPVGQVTPSEREYLDRGRRVLRDRILQTTAAVGETLRVYDDAYDALTQRSDPIAFRDFLLRAPRMFTRLGEQLGAIQHVISFWRFRFAAGAAPVGPEELIDIFMDFESGLSEREPTYTLPLQVA